MKELFRVFLWKNYLFLKFSWMSSCVINLACILILYIYLRSTHNVVTTPSVIHEKKTTSDLILSFPGNEEDLILYTPTNEFLDELIEKVRTDLLLPIEKIKPYKNASDMILALESRQKENCFAIHFEEWPTSNLETPLRYSMSSSMTNISPKERFVNDHDANRFIIDDEYIRTGFLTLQHIIDLNFIKILSHSDDGFEIDISPLPNAALQVVDGQRINIFGGLYAVLFNVLLLTITLMPLVEEKHDGIKEFLVLATPHNFLNGLTFFCVRLLTYLPFICGCIIIGLTYDALGLIPVIYFVVLFVFYCSASMCYAFLISVCFNSVFSAKIGGFLLLIIPYVLYVVDGKISDVATFLFSTTTFLEGLDTFQVFTNKHRNFSFDDLFFNITQTKLKMITVLLIFLFQIMIYTSLYNYLSKIFPGKGGLKQSPLYFLKPSFLNKKDSNQFIISTDNAQDNAIIVQDLVKIFSTKTREIVIADHLNMEIKDQKITVLLGHNGAGKTTLLNMIIGCVPKDAGSISVCSEKDVISYRHLIGFCPQHSVYMQYMTCYEHLQFFAELRGKSKYEAASISSELLSQLKLVEKAKDYGKQLSGGMKRRLSLGIALSGETKVVILDEPSSGLDIESRRELWDILLELRKSKAVLVTTHHMEEAEVLGDNVSILSNGKLLQTGSPLELKRKSGAGYVLKLRTDGCFREETTLDIIRSEVPTATIMNTVPPTVLVSMPYFYKDKYSEVLQKLENDKCTLGIDSMSITDSSLEDVFLNCQSTDDIDSPNKTRDEIVNIKYQKLVSDSIKWTRQMHAIFYKKLIFIKSQWAYSISMFSLPFLCISLALFIVSSMTLSPTDDSLKLDLQHLQNGVIYLSASKEMSFIKDILRREIEKKGIKTKSLTNNSNIEEELLSIQESNAYNFYEHVIGAIVIDKIAHYRILYSNNIIHSSVIMINLIDNVFLKLKRESGGSSIVTIFQPIQRVTDINPISLGYFAAIVPIGFFFYMLYYVSLPYLECRSEFKMLQPIPQASYWISTAAFDMLLHIIVCIACYIFQYLIMPTKLYNSQYQAVLLFTYVFYGFSYFPIMYSMAIGFRSLSALSTYLFFMFVISSIMPFITSDNVQLMQKFETTISILSILPDFSLSHQLRVINEHFLHERRQAMIQTILPNNVLRQQECPSLITFFIYAIVVFTFATIFLIFLWDNSERRQRIKKIICCNFKRNLLLDQPLEEEDESLVRSEKRKIEEIFQSNTEDAYPLLVQNLHKFYGDVHAVRGINFVVKKQECFGLLGVNGAGKTSTFQMITANLPMSGGQIMIEGASILKQKQLYKYRFGYCPQKHCLNNFMTSYEILKFMALLRNIDRADLDNEVKHWLCHMDLLKYENVQTRFYSGGTKRKLNVAIAMIGNPSLILLDEPTTGVDPISRRFLWKGIQEFQRHGRTVVLTSHSMDECEHLCNRLTIMANGKLQCLGYIPDLKAKYGNGFTIKIKLLDHCPKNAINVITASLEKEFTCELREQHAGMLTYFIKSRSIDWADVFRRTERFMKSYSDIVQDYSVNESTLEDIFLKFENKSPGVNEQAC